MINQEKKSDLSNISTSLPELSALSILEMQVINEYVANGENGTQAYQTIKPHVGYDTARVESSELIRRPHVQAYLQAYKAALLSKSALTKDSLIADTQWGIQRAKSKEELSAMFKGIEVGAKLINAYDSEADDLTKYTGLLSKITANNVQINIGCKPSKDLQVNNGDDS